MSAHVWYVSFGSNMLAERLDRYLARARDSSPPTDSRPLDLGHPVVFAGETKVWGSGGVAFLDPTSRADGPSHGRAWRLTLGQFEDIYRIENRLGKIAPVDIDSITPDSLATRDDGFYGAIKRFTDIDGEAAITFTSATRPAQLNPSGPMYLRVIAAGLVEGWGLGAEEIADYLHGCAPNSDLYSRGQMADLLSQPMELY